MNRDEMLARAQGRADPWDMIVIGGGATGMGVAVDAVSRGLSVLLLEREDFGKGTSSRSTKMIHGGVRYLEQGNIRLVRMDLKERGILRGNAPHIVRDREFVVPGYSWWQAPFYGVGLIFYDLLAGRRRFGRSQVLSREETLKRVPNLNPNGLRGAAVYHDGQFDDSRLLMHLALTAADHGATVLNYCGVESFVMENGRVAGVTARDGESGQMIQALGRSVINATGIFSDEVRRMAEPGVDASIAPSQGVHLVFDGSFLTGGSAVLVPHTKDGRVLFAIPWHDHVLAGTTDTPVDAPHYEPLPREDEISFIIETLGQYLAKAPQRGDVLSVFTGIRPLAKSGGALGKSLSRGHALREDRTGLLSIAGGKWTTYRAMAEDCVDRAVALAKLQVSPCVTRTLRLHGWQEEAAGPLAVYGTDGEAIRCIVAETFDLDRLLHPALPYIAAEVVWAVRHEMARTLDDMLARRLRALFLNARAAIEIAPDVASLMACELGVGEEWIVRELAKFQAIAAHYLLPSH